MRLFNAIVVPTVLYGAESWVGKPLMIWNETSKENMQRETAADDNESADKKDERN